MALKLLTLLVLFALCGIGDAQDCSRYCSGNQVQDPASARSVVRGQKHGASRSRGHPAAASRQHDASSRGPYPAECSSFCASSNRRSAAGSISSRQSISDLFGFPDMDPFNMFPGSGSESSGLGSSDSGSSLASIAGFPGFSQQFGGFGTPGSQGNSLSSILGPLGGSSSGSGTTGSSGGGFGFPQFTGMSQLMNDFFGGRGTEDPSSSSGGQFGQNQISYCEQACYSRRQGAGRGHRRRHGGRLQRAGAQHTRQAGGCPAYCQLLLEDQGSSAANSELEASANGSDGSYTGSASSSLNSDDSKGAEDDSVTV